MTELSNKSTSNKNDNSGLAFSKNHDNRLIFKKNNGNDEVEFYDNSRKYAKKLRKSKSLKLAKL